MSVSRSFVLLSVLATSLFACSDDNPSMTGPESRPGPPQVMDAQVLVGGRPVQGVVVQGTDDPSLFRVRIHAPGGLQTIQRVSLRYSQPGPNYHGGFHGGPMMGGFNGTVFCYDDGTHGDDIAGDGIYHFMDPEDQIGCHGIGSAPGDYHYEFWCDDIYGQQSNVASVTITRR